MSALSQASMDARYCIGGNEMDFGRMFDQYLHKGSENFDLSLSIPDSASHHANYMSDQLNYTNYDSSGRTGPGDSYLHDVGGQMGSQVGQQEPDTTSAHGPPTPHTAVPMAHHQPPMYSPQMGLPQFPPQNIYIPPIAQHPSMMNAQTVGYAPAGHGCPPSLVYTSASGMPAQHMPCHTAAPNGGLPMMNYYQRPSATRSSPASGGSPSPGSADDSDDSTPLTQSVCLSVRQMGRGKRPSSESTEPPPAGGAGRGGKKPKVTKKSKKKKDPNEPNKPVSAYALFFRDTQAAIKGQNPSASFGEVSKIVASMWDSLGADHKGVYKKKTEAAKKEYLKALAAYRASLVSKQAAPSLASPGSAPDSSSPGPQQQQQHQIPPQQQANGSQQPPQHHHLPPQQSPTQPPQGGGGGGGPSQPLGQQPHPGCTPNAASSCIRSGCTNPAISNPEWENEYCSNECVVSHCTDVFTTWVANNQANAPTYHVPVK